MKGQSIIEYIIILGVIIVALYAMGPYLKRGVQSVIKGTADQLAFQKNSDQDFSPDSSHMESSASMTNAQNQRTVEGLNGRTSTTVNESTNTITETTTSMGFSQ